MKTVLMPRRRAGYTLIELVAVMVLIGTLALVAIPRFFDWSGDAKTSAAEGSISGIRTALKMAHLHHRMLDAPASEWVLALSDIAGTMNTGQLPEGVTIVGANLVDQEGNQYTLTPETEAVPAELTKVGGGGGGS